MGSFFLSCLDYYRDGQLQISCLAGTTPSIVSGVATDNLADLLTKMSTSKKEQIGFLGLGAMGFGMAANLVKSGYQVKGYDVFAKSVERFVNAGGLAATSLSDSATGCGYYVCMVATASQAQSAIFDQDGALAKGTFCMLDQALHRDIFWSGLGVLIAEEPRSSS